MPLPFGWAFDTQLVWPWCPSNIPGQAVPTNAGDRIDVTRVAREWDC